MPSLSLYLFSASCISSSPNHSSSTLQKKNKNILAFQEPRSDLEPEKKTVFRFPKMFLRSAVLALPYSTLHGNGKGNGHGGYASSSSALSLRSKQTFSSNFGFNSENENWGKKFVASASREHDFVPLEGVVFRPFEEVQKDSLLVPSNLQLSLARQHFSDVSEAAVNEQIK